MSSSTQVSLFDEPPVEAPPPVEALPVKPRRKNKLHSSKHKRRERDFYETPPDLCDALVDGLARLGLVLPAVALDPCGGAGAIRMALEPHGVDIRLTDIAPDAYRGTDGYVSQEPLDATRIDHLRRAVSFAGVRTIISNTPYANLAQPIARNLVSLVESGELDMVALLFSALWAGADGRAPIFGSTTYTGRVDALWRPELIAGTGGGGTMPFAWFVWSRSPTARTVSITREQAAEVRRRAIAARGSRS